MKMAHDQKKNIKQILFYNSTKFSLYYYKRQGSSASVQKKKIFQHHLFMRIIIWGEEKLDKDLLTQCNTVINLLPRTKIVK